MSHDIQTTAVAEADNLPVELPATDEERAKALAAQLENGSLAAIYSFGRELGSQASSYADSLLEQVKPKELDCIGGKLNEIVVSAQTINLHSLAGKRSKVPLIGGFIDKMRLKAPISPASSTACGSRSTNWSPKSRKCRGRWPCACKRWTRLSKPSSRSTGS